VDFLLLFPLQRDLHWFRCVPRIRVNQNRHWRTRFVSSGPVTRC